MMLSTLLHVVTVSVATLPLGHGVVLLVEVLVMVRDHCSVLVDALSLCVSLDNCAETVWLCIVTRLTCTTVEHGKFQTVAVVVKLSSVYPKQSADLAFCCHRFVDLCLLMCFIDNHFSCIYSVFL